MAIDLMVDLSVFEEHATSMHDVKDGLKKAGFSGKELDDQLTSFQHRQQETTGAHYKRLNSLFGFKEFLDRVAYGFGATQFVTIFFFLTGGSALLVGIVNGAKDLLGGLLSSFLHQYSHVQSIGKNFIANCGILFGFSFLGLLLAIRTNNSILFAIFVLLGSVGVVAYGELHMRLYEKSLPYEKKSSFLKKLTRNGLFITAIVFVATAFIIDSFGVEKIMVGSFTLPLSGYFLVFEVAAIAFIISGFILSKLPYNAQKVHYPFWKFFKEYVQSLSLQSKKFFSSTRITLLFLGQTTTTLIQSLGASYYGYYLYLLFENSLYGPFLNIAIIFGVAILVSFLGPVFTRFMQKQAGLAPMFVFGTLLVAIMPLTLLYNTYYFALIAATSAMVIGASTLGVAQELLNRKILLSEERKTYLQTQNIMMILPFVIFIPLGAWTAEAYSFETLFRIILYVLICFVAPLYLILVLKSHKERL